MSRRALSVIAGLVAVLAGCTSLAPEPQYAVDYACEGGGGFRLSSVAGETVIEVAQMKFALQPEASPPGEEVLSCSMLRLVRRGELATLEMDGKPHFDGCRPRR